MPVRRSVDLLGEIEAAALDPTSDLPAVLRKCIKLGGVTGSERLREWAVRELKGYDGDDELPPYRQVVAPLVMDAAKFNAIIKGQEVPLTMIPAAIRDDVTTDCPFPQPIAELADLLSSARSRGEESVRVAPAGARELVALMNHQLADTYQDVERVYYAVSLPPIARILDVVRTTLVELVAEMRAGMPSGSELPSREAVDQALDISIGGKRHRVVVVNQVASASQVAGAGGTAAIGTEAESSGRRVMSWVVALATVASAVAAVWVWL